LEADIPTAWWQGLSFGFHCSCCCLNLTAILLVFGVMDIRAMAVVTAAITLERLAPAGETVARIIGGIAMGLGSLLFLRAVDLL
jgi:predicted metal-binding membrane protein